MEIFNKKVKEYLQARNDLVKQGRKLSAKIEILDLKIEKNKDKQRKYTSEIEPKELIDEGNELSKKIEADLTKLEEIQKEVHKIKILNVPQSVGQEYEDLKKQKEDLEIERNKIALKVQKQKDRLIPIVQKIVAPTLGEFDDLETVELNGEKIEVKIYNHVDDFIKAFREKNKK